jgi:hypothetical protein
MKRLFGLAKVVGVSLLISAVSFAASDPGTQSVVYDGSQSDYSIVLKNEVSQTVYENKDVPDTCYRTVPDGTETQCQVETHQVCGADTIKHVCENTTRQECTPVTRQECGPVNQQECTTSSRRECHNESRRECTPVSRNECTTHQVCREVGHTQQCSPEQECHTVTDQDCRDVSNQVCSDVPYQDCREVSHNECHNVTDNVCKSIPETVCHDDHIPNCQDVSKTVCGVVQKTRQESYACTKTIQVPVGTDLISSDIANVSLHIDPSAGPVLASSLATAGQKFSEQFVCSLASGSVAFQLNGDAAPSILLFEQLSQNLVTVDDKHRQITANVQVRGIDLAAAEAPLNGDVEDAAMTENSLQFSLEKLTRAITRTSDQASVLAEQPIDLSKAKLTNTAAGRTLISLDLSQLGIAAGTITPDSYQLQITGTLSIDGLAGVMNPSAFAGFSQLSASPQVTVPEGLSEIAQITANGIQNLDLEPAGLVFEIGQMKSPDFVTVHVKIEKDVLWGVFHSSTYDGDVDSSNLDVSDINGGVNSRVIVSSLGVEDGTYEVTVTVTPNVAVLSKLLTADQIKLLKTVTAEQKFDLD